MNKPLKEYSIDELAKRVESGGDTSGQKAESILIAKCMLNLGISIEVLTHQLFLTGSNIQNSIIQSTDKITKSTDQLTEEIKNYSESNSRYAAAMKWLTGALVLVGITQIIFSYLINHANTK